MPDFNNGEKFANRDLGDAAEAARKARIVQVQGGLAVQGVTFGGALESQTPAIKVPSQPIVVQGYN